jgi:hypothetical protein
MVSTIIYTGGASMDEAVWQPILLLTDKAVLCECGKPAIILTLENDDYTAWCQMCFEKEDDSE